VVAQRLDVIEDARDEMFGRFDDRKAGQAVRDAFVLFVDGLTVFATSEVGDGVLAARFDPRTHIVPERFDITTPH
jgi:hypothetical protein